MTTPMQLTIWMRLRNARETMAGLTRTAAATKVLGASVDTLATHLDRASKRGHIMNQVIFTMRRYSYMATLGLTAAGLALVKWGFEYNSQVQIAKVAFRQFGLTTAEVNKEIHDLYTVAAYSPFLFTDITNVARRFLAFGFSLQTTNDLIKNLANSFSAYGITSGAALNRAALALSHMNTLGRLNGRILYQLSQDNVPMVQALETELGLTGDQLRNVAKLGIPASAAVAALNKYISETPRFQNAALRFSLRTWKGVITTTRDYLAQFMGIIEKPLFLRLQKGAFNFMMWLRSAAVQKAALQGNIAGVIGTFSPGLARLWTQLEIAIKGVWNILNNALIPAFLYVAKVAAPFVFAAVYMLAHIFEFMGHHTLLLKLFFGLLALELAFMAARMLFLLPIQIALNMAQMSGTAILRILNALGLIRIATVNRETGAEVLNTESKYKNQIMSTKLTRALKLDVLWRTLSTKAMRLWMAVSKGYVIAANGQFVKITKLEKALLAARKATIAFAVATRAATASVIAFLLTNPIGWAILLIAALGLLYWKVHAVRKMFNQMWKDLAVWAPLIGGALTIAFGPIGAAVMGLLLIIRYWGRIKGFFAGAGGGGQTNPAFGTSFGGGNTFAPLYHNGQVSTGPTISAPGSSVSKMGIADQSWQHNVSGGISVTSHSVLNVDGKKMAEAVSKHRLDARARR